MTYINRDLEEKIKSASKEYACILITGARQVGKSTVLKRLMDDNREEVLLDDIEERKLASKDPALFLQMHSLPILIDEVQYAPELFSYIKMAIDKGAAPGSFWLTGSQPFKLMELAQESLAGRIAIIHMPSLSQHEIYGHDKTEPFSIDLDKLKKRSKINKPADLNEIYRRIWSGSCRAGQMLNVSDIARDVGISNDTAKRWLKILEKSDIVFFLRPYSNNLLKRTIKTPKMYFFDTGLVAYLTRYSSPEILANGAINGAILENYVVSEIIKTYHNNAKECLIWYYRDTNSNEIESDGMLHPIEIKRTASPGTELIKPFKLLDKASVPRGKGAIICMKETLSAVDSDNYIVPIWMI